MHRWPRHLLLRGRIFLFRRLLSKCIITISNSSNIFNSICISSNSKTNNNTFRPWRSCTSNAVKFSCPNNWNNNKVNLKDNSKVKKEEEEEEKTRKEELEGKKRYDNGTTMKKLW